MRGVHDFSRESSEITRFFAEKAIKIRITSNLALFGTSSLVSIQMSNLALFGMSSLVSTSVNVCFDPTSGSQ